jgi:6-phosphogluconolactonase
MKITRRLFVPWLLLVGPVLLFPSTQAPQKSASQQYLVYVGTFTTKYSSKGIYVFRFDAATGQLSPIGLAAESPDPSFLAADPSEKYLYAVNEIDNFNGGNHGAVSAFAIDRKSGALKLLNQVSTHGARPCHISLDTTGRFALVANYEGGSVATFPVQYDGSLGLIAGFVQHSGSSIDKDRQEGPHAHWIGPSPDNRFVMVADLGLDDVLVYRLDLSKGSLTPDDPPYAQVQPGSGPRHIAFHPSAKFAYVLNEMASNVTVFGYQAQKGSLSPIQTISALPKDYSGGKHAAELVVHPSGKFLYASNRGHDSIAVFAIHPTKGTLILTGNVATKGRTPRNFALDPTGKFLLAANQDSGNIVIFRIDAATGELTPTGQVVETPAPVCIIFVRPE